MNLSSASSLVAGTEYDAPEVEQSDFALPSHIQEHIGRRLAAAYDEILRQPIPERFRLLLEQLDRSAKPANDQSSGKETEID